jgi:hypothetical protein
MRVYNEYYSDFCDTLLRIFIWVGLVIVLFNIGNIIHYSIQLNFLMVALALPLTILSIWFLTLGFKAYLKFKFNTSDLRVMFWYYTEFKHLGEAQYEYMLQLKDNPTVLMSSAFTIEVYFIERGKWYCSLPPEHRVIGMAFKNRDDMLLAKLML